MKKLALSLAALVAFAMVSCGGNKANENEGEQTPEMENVDDNNTVNEGDENQPQVIEEGAVVVEETVAPEAGKTPETTTKTTTTTTTTTNKTVKEKVEDAVATGKEVVETGKEVVNDVKETVNTTVDKAKEAKDKLKSLKK